jgi:hypothetical protein
LRIVLPALEGKVHPGVRAALWRLAEEAELQAEQAAHRRAWLDGVARARERGRLELPVARSGVLPSAQELSDVLSLLQTFWPDAEAALCAKQVQALRGLFGAGGTGREAQLSGGLRASRRGWQVILGPKG